MANAADLALLRRYEPVLRFTRGEQFFPTSAANYVQQCSLWQYREHQTPRRLVQAGELTLERLGQIGREYPGEALYLRYVQQPLTPLEYERWVRRPERPVFQARGRLARVGLLARLIDAAFSLSIFLRGTVPGWTIAAAARQYAATEVQHPAYVYHGRVLRDGGYIVLQYLFFYAMNDWRSSFFGANDHEADWEQVFVFLDECDESVPEPAWVAYASHINAGDTLRRRWDDPEVRREGTHPVVFIAAGSHAAYFQPGEYLIRVRFGRLRPLLRALDLVERLWRNVLHQGGNPHITDRVERLFSVPFVEYARGDGLSIGPGRPAQWTPTVISDEVEWVDDYRGLWGLDTRDPIPAAERAPAGPKYTQQGALRRTWHDPLGWVGLDTVVPPRAIIVTLEEHLAELEETRNTIEEDIERLRALGRRLDLEVQALQHGTYSDVLLEQRSEELARHERELAALQRRHADVLEGIAACREHLERVMAGDLGDPRSHLRGEYVPEPETPEAMRQQMLADIWSAVSVGLLMLGIVLFVIPGFAPITATVAVSIGTFILIESAFHRRLQRLLLNLTIVLAIATSAVLLYRFHVEILLAASIALAILIISDNVRELRGRR